MLIRVRGGRAGIVEYLEDGRKSGRDYTRQELDERVILQGDLSVIGATVGGMDSSGERYLHVTISFREDEIDGETLCAIAEDFRQFAMAAYSPDEYCYYVEAHLPKIRSYMNAATGELVERKPHIHIVVPLTNLLTGLRLEPLGRVDNQIPYLDAWQERTNARYGLASPKDHRRVEIMSESTILSRVKGDIFKGAGHELKTRILGEILDRDMRTAAEFRALLAEHGVVRERNAGRPGAYFNVKPVDRPRGVNLKEFVFSREFLELSKSAKVARLERSERKELATARKDAADVLRIEPDAALFAAFRAGAAPMAAEAKTEAVAALQQVESARFLEMRERQITERSLVEGDYSRPWAHRKAALAALRLEHAQQHEALRNEIEVQRREMERRHGLAAQYRAFLAERVKAGDVLTRAELGRQLAGGSIESEHAEPTTSSFSLAGTSTKADRSGRVAWLDDRQRVLMIDAGHKVVVPSEDDRAIQGGLRLALAKYGSRRGLQLDGTPEFKARAVQIAAREGLRIKFSDPSMQAGLDRQRDEIKAAAITQSARALTQAEKEDALVHEWHERRAHEVRWIPGSGGVAERYRAASPEQQAEILVERAEAYSRRWRGAEIENSRLPALDRQPHRDAPELPVPRKDRDGRPVDSVAGQLIGQIHHERAVALDADLSEFARIKLEVDATRLLATISRTHGVQIEQYGVVKGRDGADLIEAGNRRLPVNDFLTKQMHLPWIEAKAILRAVYRDQQSGAPAERAKPEPRRELWNAYLREWKPGARARRAEAYREQRASEKARREGLRKDLADRRFLIQDNPGLSWRGRKAALVSLRLEAVSEKLQMRDAIEAERAALEQIHCMRPDEQYRAFLADRAGKGDAAALRELRAQRDGPVKDLGLESGRIIGGEGGHGFVQGLEYKVDVKGNVSYLRKGQAIIVDGASSLSVPSEDSQAVEIALRVACEKYRGRELRLDGTENFKKMAVEIAARKELAIRFADPEMQADLAARRASLPRVQF